MKKTLLLSLAASAALFAASQTASAEYDVRDVVHDNQGHVVKNTFNHCVRTKWVAGHDGCEKMDREMLTVYFGFDSAQLTPAAMSKLDTVVDMLAGASNVNSVDIVGYADMIGNSRYNYNLSQRRANSVKSYLQSRGYLNTNDVSVRGFGEDAPVSECGGMKGNELKACLWRDRRVEIELNFAQ